MLYFFGELNQYSINPCHYKFKEPVGNFHQNDIKPDVPFFTYAGLFLTNSMG